MPVDQHCKVPGEGFFIISLPDKICFTYVLQTILNYSYTHSLPICKTSAVLLDENLQCCCCGIVLLLFSKRVNLKLVVNAVSS